MATVYLADDIRHERQVAIKVLKAELAAVIGADRFLAEIRTTANLQHPHILPLFDSGEALWCGGGECPPKAPSYLPSPIQITLHLLSLANTFRVYAISLFLVFFPTISAMKATIRLGTGRC